MNAWQRNAQKLADWITATMVNRTDVWGIYGSWTDNYGVEHLTRTGPAKIQRGNVFLTPQHIANHFTGSPIIGLHSTNADDTCRWIAFDIDAHDEGDVAATNWSAAQRIIAQLATHGLAALVEDSNGKGGLHVWIIFSAPVPSPDAFAFAQSIITAANVQCETFPKQARASETNNRYGNYIRLPGKHYKRDHWSRIWDGKEWLTEDAAIAAIFAIAPNNPSIVPPAPPPPPTPAIAPSRFAVSDPDRDMQTAANALSYIPNDMTYDEWIKVGMILKDVGGESAYPLFEQWSATNPKFEPKITRMKWDSFGGKATKRAGVGTLVHLAKDRGYITASTLVTDFEGYNCATGVILQPDAETITEAEPDEADDSTAPAAPLAETVNTLATTPPPQPVAAVATSTETPPDAELKWTPFPIDILPGPFQEFIAAGAEAKSAPMEFVVLPLLAACAAAIGMSRRIQLTDDWSEPAILWACMIGSSGTVKTPCLRLATRTNAKISEEAHAKFHLAKLAYDEEEEKWEREYKGKKKGYDTPSKPVCPTEEQFVCDDTTIEALAMVLKDNPRGLLLANDELSGFFKSFGAYKQGRGADKEHWLKVFSSSPWHINRKVGEVKHLYVPPSAVSIAGATQPDILREILTPEFYQSGMIARFLLAMPPGKANHFSRTKIPDHTKTAVDAAIRALFALRMQETAAGEKRPKPVHLSPDALDVWEDFQNSIGDETIRMDDKAQAVWAKAPTYGARLSLVLHFMRAAIGEADQEEIDMESTLCGIEMTRWFLNETRRIYSLFDESPDERIHKKIVALLATRGGSMSTREIRQYGNFKSKEDLVRLLTDMIRLKLVTCQHKVPSTAGGHPTEIITLTDTAKPKNATTLPPF